MVRAEIEGTLTASYIVVVFASRPDVGAPEPLVSSSFMDVGELIAFNALCSHMIPLHHPLIK